MAELNEVIKDSFIQFSGAVLQSRALVDVRDCIKPSARQIFYCMKTDKFTYDKPYQKTLKAIGSASRLYIHGDASAEGVIMRAGQPFAMRYPLVDIEGSYGTLLSSGSWAAPRYTSARLSKLSEYLFQDIDKETIEEWRDNYDNTEQYPVVLPSKGFYNIVNGSYGIGVGASASIPQYNIKELNNALITLLNNPNADFDSIYVAPDFATGGILLNASEVKESHRLGYGAACKLRSVVDYDEKERCLVVKELPYMVYTETICKELETILSSEDNFGIDRFNDLTGEKPQIKIYLTKQANPTKTLVKLFKETSLQSYYSVNFTLLDNGRFPKRFTWKEMLQAHLDHEKVVYKRGYEFDLRKIEQRLHIIDGLLICMANIDEVVQTIKASTSTAAASSVLQSKFLLDEAQAKAVLDMKLSRLAHLEVKKLEDEKDKLTNDASHIRAILEDEKLLNAEIEKGLREVATKFGDERRTKVTDFETENQEPTNVQNYQISLTNKGNLLMCETSSLYTQKRGGTGVKIKLDSNEYIIESINADSSDTLLLFTKDGTYTHCAIATLSLDQKVPADSICNLKDSAQVCAIAAMNPKSNKKSNIIFVTKYGYVKKSLFSEYGITRSVEKYAIDLEDGDEIVQVLFLNEENIGIASAQGNFIIIKTSDIRPIGRVAKGIHGMKLNEDDYVISAAAIPESTKEIVSVSGEGLIKRTSLNEFSIQGKNTKGSKIQKLNEGDWLADFLPIAAVSEILIVSTRSCIRLKIGDVPLLSKAVYGNKSIKLNAQDNIISLSEI